MHVVITVGSAYKKQLDFPHHMLRLLRFWCSEQLKQCMYELSAVGKLGSVC